MSRRKNEALTYGEDGFYRWGYQLDPGKNGSLLFVMVKPLIRTALLIFGILAVLSVVRNTFSLIRLLIYGVMILVLMGLCLIFSLAGKHLKAAGNDGVILYRYKMNRDFIRRLKLTEEGSGRLLDSVEDFVRAVLAPLIGRARPMDREAEAETYFANVRKVNVYRRWNMIDLLEASASSQYYVSEGDLDAVLQVIREEVPEQVKVTEKG